LTHFAWAELDNLVLGDASDMKWIQLKHCPDTFSIVSGYENNAARAWNRAARSHK
jgi:hypothetical protein